MSATSPSESARWVACDAMMPSSSSNAAPKWPTRAFPGGAGAEGAHLREVIRERVAAGGPVVIVFDDDPTGSQVVSDVPILTSWDAAALDWALSLDRQMVFVLTNTRSLSPVDAEALLREATQAVDAAAKRAGVDYVVTCRGDSTLRGHFPLETDVVASELANLGLPVDGVLFVPAYLEAGRYTIDGTHYVKLDDALVPVGETDYARDATFGFKSSRLADYVAERTEGRIPAGEVLAITVHDLRDSGPGRVAEILEAAHHGTVVAVDAATRSDLDTLVLGLLDAEQHGKRFVYRAGPSFVAARVGMEPTAPVRPRSSSGAHGLIVVGSHVALTGRQVARLQDLPGIHAVTIDVPRLLDREGCSQVVADAARAILEALSDSDVVLMTSRGLVRGSDAQSSLHIARLVSDAVVQVVHAVNAQYALGWVIAKGGITSHDVAAKGLEIRRAVVAGQLFPGMTSVWLSVADEDENAPKNMPYVVFAGNVGDDLSLVSAVQILRGGDHA